MAQSSSITVLDAPLLSIKDVEKLELESKFRVERLLQDVRYKDEPVDRLDGHIRRAIVACEKRGRESENESIEIILDPTNPTDLTSVQRSSLAHSYQKIRNLLWIESQPVYKAALLEWQKNLEYYSSKVDRKTLRFESLKNEIYNMIGFYSVFQGVLVTASSQSSILRCRNVCIPIALSLCASIVTLVAIRQMFARIHILQGSIFKYKIHKAVCSLDACLHD